MTFQARMLNQADVAAWVSMRAELWPEADPEDLATEGPASLLADPPLVVSSSRRPERRLAFSSCRSARMRRGRRPRRCLMWEGWYVGPGVRRGGVGRALMEAAVRWSRERGYTELGSDALASNLTSHAAHRAIGFDEVETIVVFRLDLRTA